MDTNLQKPLMLAIENTSTTALHSPTESVDELKRELAALKHASALSSPPAALKQEISKINEKLFVYFLKQ